MKKEKLKLGTCCEVIHSNFSNYPCSKPGKVVDEDKVYCGIHNPERARKRNDEYEAKKKIDEDRNDRKIAYNTAKNHVINISKEWYKGQADERDLSRAVKEMMKAEGDL